jgi:hypothetical protein
VVDPGVGTSRRAIAARLGDFYFVGPDNGLMTFLYQRARQQGHLIQCVHLDEPGFWLPQVSPVFHGRDIFAPVGAHLAKGAPLLELGTLIDDPVLLQIPTPQKIVNGWRGEVIHIDRFGNLATNIEAGHIQAAERVVVRIGGATIQGLVNAYGEGQPGELVALIDSAQYLSIGLVNGSAQKALGATVGDQVILWIGLAGENRP